MKRIHLMIAILLIVGLALPFGTSFVSASAQSELQYWKAGDQHVHTNHSDGWLLSVYDQAQEAKNAGLSWVIITDHHTMMDAEEWETERNECVEAQNSIGIEVMCGLEVGSIDARDYPVGSAGHYLAYDINSYVNPPNDCQAMIDAVYQQAGGFGFIAHPYGSPNEWVDWNVTGYTGLEIMHSNSPSAESISKWNEILEDPSARVFGIGNTDSHWQWQMGDTVTYCYIEEEEVDHDDIYDALENGHSVVSNGPLITFKIGDKRIGDTVLMTASTVVLDIAWDAQPLDAQQSGQIQQIQIISNDLEINKDVSGETGSTSVTVAVTPQTRYLRLQGIFSNGEAYTNPIWVPVRGVKGRVGNAATGYPIPYATVTVQETGQSVTTNYYGQYQIYIEQSGTYHVTASHAQFQPRTYHAYVPECGFFTLNFMLIPESPIPPPIFY